MSHQNFHENVKLDMRGLNCPAPILGVKRLIGDLANEQILLLLSNCPGTSDDLFAWAEQTNNQILKTEVLPDGGTGYYVRKGTGASVKANVILDICDVVCPGPIIEAKKLLNGMNSGEILKLVSNCPGIHSDIIDWAEATGVTIVDSSEIDSDVYAFFLQKG
ncbi:MAG: sulfurtransferase TusA family protein [Proteobacteria bacterium]|nr:sulfurtransferase TusA family protein [Pseudomonadota bacterium]